MNKLNVKSTIDNGSLTKLIFQLKNNNYNEIDICLDPFPFGGCNTTFEAFDYNIPVITLPSTQLHGRFTYGLYGKMDMSDCECIVWTAEEYAQIASRVAINDKLRHKIQRAIETGKSQIFQERDSVDEWNEYLVNLA
jgi:predicted O-linked N-acetylglucosamine transferase (SPINDLY family)